MDFSAKLLNHLGNDMVLQYADAPRQNLHRQMPIAEMPRYTEQYLIGGSDFQKRFRLGANAHDAAIFKFKPVAIPEMRGMRKIQQDVLPPFGLQNKTTAVAIMVVKQNAVTFP